MKSLFLILSGIFFLGTATACTQETAPTSKDTKTMYMKIEGMTCSACAAIIKKKLSPLCTTTSIDHKTGDGQCIYEADKANQDAIVKAVTDAGYKVVEVR